MASAGSGELGSRSKTPAVAGANAEEPSGFVVAVIIPVYNAAAYVRESVESALAQPEVGEVILVDDGSADGSLEICAALAGEHERVRLLRHPDKGNHGAGPSRDLGIGSARFDFVAFLDADDLYLPGRFSVTRTVFEGDPSIDGVYEAVGYLVKDEVMAAEWKVSNPKELITIHEPVPPEELFEQMGPVGSRVGWFCVPGFVVRRSLFSRTGPHELGRHQDTVMWVKMAGLGRLAPGRVDAPVSLYRIHGANTSLQVTDKVRRKEWQRNWLTLWRWSRFNLNRSRRDLLIDRLMGATSKPRAPARWEVYNRCQALAQVTWLLIQNPDLGQERRFWWRYAKNVHALIPVRRLLRRFRRPSGRP